MLTLHLIRWVVLSSEVIFSFPRDFPWLIPAVHKPAIGVRLRGVGVYMTVTLPAQSHKIRKPESNFLIARPAHAFHFAVMNVSRRARAPLAGLLVTFQSPPPCLIPG